MSRSFSLRTFPGSCLGLLLSVAAASCSGTASSVKPDEMSAAQHREEAAREQEAARREASLYRPGAAQPSPFGAPMGADGTSGVPIYNPTEGHLAEADWHRRHAREHEKAAQALERSEDAACRALAPAARAACPFLGPVVRIDDIDGGVRVTFKPGAQIDTIVTQMRCHYAFSRTRAFAETASCPLYLRGIEIRRAADPAAVEITSRDPQAAAEIRVRSRQEAIFVRSEDPSQRGAP
jgi:hypothetical protein